MSFRELAGLIALLAALPQCSKSPPEEISPAPTASSISTSAPHPAASSSESNPSPAQDASLRWDDPSRWRRRPASSPMRVAEYTVPRAAGDSSDAECTVITFGPNQGGSVADNVGRWVRQFSPLAGAPSNITRQVGAMKVTRVEVAGTYHPMTMPGMPSEPAGQSGSRLIGAIVEAPSGLWFFKLTGPDATVRAGAPEFDGMVDSLRTGSQ